MLQRLVVVTDDAEVIEAQRAVRFREVRGEVQHTIQRDLGTGQLLRRAVHVGVVHPHVSDRQPCVRRREIRVQGNGLLIQAGRRAHVCRIELPIHQHTSTQIQVISL